MFFRQIKQRGDNFSYVIADNDTGEAAVIDPSFNTDAILRALTENRLKLELIINTHHHTDHTAGNQDLKSRYPAKIIAYTSSRARKDRGVVDGEIIKLGKVEIKVIHTPGHTSDGICLLVDNKLFTGDTLFVGECGRTDLPDGNTREMYDSLFNKLMKLDDSVEVYPGHDYGSTPTSTIGQEKKSNYTLEKRTLEEFTEFMKEP
jgi:hydroxyacylglutathione hydrolase